MHLVVDAAGQQVLPGCVDHSIRCKVLQIVTDAGNTTIFNEQVSFADGAFVDETGVEQEGGIHWRMSRGVVVQITLYDISVKAYD
jgi:hypothetical protein